MKLIHLVIAAITSFYAFGAKAEYINGQKVWVAADKDRIGMVAAVPFGNPNLRRWSGKTFSYDCNLESSNQVQFKAIIYCPSIQYRIEMQRNQVLIATNGGIQTYPGSWDDRRAWKYTKGDIQGQFILLDGFKWQEIQSRNRSIVGRFNFVETWRDATYIYMYDESRRVHFSLTRDGGWISNYGDSGYTKIYTGSW